MRVVRVCRAKYPDLDGKGAALSGGRWNSKRTHIVYTSSCGALSVLEYRVHTRVDPGDLVIFTIEIPDRLAIEKATWMPDLDTARRFGDFWVRSNRSPILAVPSVVVPNQINYLLNPQHPALGRQIAIVGKHALALDLRLFDITSSRSNRKRTRYSAGFPVQEPRRRWPSERWPDSELFAGCAHRALRRRCATSFPPRGGQRHTCSWLFAGA